jgi:raffinose/stachyose/melibiose transport system substrate-binding protein
MRRPDPSVAIASLLVVSLALASGCGRDEGPEERAGAPEQVELSLWHIMTYDPPRTVLLDAAERFEAEHPGVTVQVEDIKNDAFKQKLASEMSGGRPPDVFHTWGGGPLAAYARAGKVLDLTKGLEQDGWRGSFNPTALGFCTFSGRTYAVPVDISVVPMWYNKELFAQHGLRPPETFADLAAACRKLRAAGVTPLALGNADQWPGAFYFVYLATRLGGTDLFEQAVAGQGTVSLADARFIQAGERLRELVDAKAFSVGFNGLKTDQARAEFLGGRAAMYLMGTWLVARVKGDNPSFMDKLDCFAFPTVEGGDGTPGTVVGGTNAAFAVSSACKHPELALDLLRALTTARVARGWAKAGRLPAMAGAEDAPDLPVPSRRALALLDEAPKVQLYYDQYLSPALATAHKETTQAILAGVMTPEHAAKEMARLADESR